MHCIVNCTAQISDRHRGYIFRRDKLASCELSDRVDGAVDGWLGLHLELMTTCSLQYTTRVVFTVHPKENQQVIPRIVRDSLI